jgi:hypothetical protein
VLAAAEQHGVSCLLADALAAASAREAAAFVHRSRAEAVRDIVVQHELRGLLQAFAGDGVRVLVVKGSALAYTLYVQPWHRPRLDTDILVAEEDVAAAIAVLSARGYAASPAISTGQLVSHQAPYERTDVRGARHVIDLHWKVVNPQLLAAALTFDHLWARAASAPPLGPAARVPRAVDALILACVHRLAHHQSFERLIWLYDLRLLSRALAADDWTDLCRTACANGVASLCLDGLRHARTRVGAELPAPFEAELEAAGQWERSRAYVHGSLSRRDVLVSDLRTLPTWRQRLRLLREHAFPPAPFMRHRYGVRGRLWLPALYVHRLVSGASRWLKA